MLQHFSPLLTIRHPSEEAQRRGQNVIVLAGGLTCVGLLATLAMLLGFGTREASGVIATLVSLIAFGVTIWLARRGLVTFAALLLITCVIGALLGTAVASPLASSLAPFYYILPLLIAGITLRPWAIGITFLACLISLGLLLPLRAAAPLVALPFSVAVFHGALLCGMTAMTSVLGAMSTVRALRAAQVAQAAAEAATTQIAQANAALDARVAERTAALASALSTQAAQAQALQAALDAQRALDAVIDDLSLPIIPIQKGVLIAPLIGTLDSQRTSKLLGDVLAQIEQHHARALLLDVTGVPIIDSHVGQALLHTATAARLLGAQVIVVGIRPEVAQALVGLGIDLAMLQPHATLLQGLEALNAQARR